MVPQYWSWVLDHLVAANKMSRISQEEGIEDLGGIKYINSVPLLGDYIFRIDLLQSRT